MAYTSGLTTFNLDLTELIEEAFERCGAQLRSGYNMKTARRSINLMTIEWANRGINLWTIEECSIPLVANQGVYPLPIDTIDILDAVTRTNNASTSNQTDINLSRLSEPTYITIPNKNTNGRPIQMWVNRQSGGSSSLAQTTLNGGIDADDTTITLANASNLPTQGFINIDNETIGYQNIVGNQILNAWRGQNGTTAASHSTAASVFNNQLPSINVWPTPNPPGNQFTLVYYRMRRIQDGGTGVRTQDIPFRFIPCMVAGLAYYLSSKLPGVDPGRIPMLKTEYEQQFQLAADEDREKAAIRFVPRNTFYS